MDKTKKIYIAGHKGMVGSAIWRKLKAEGYRHLVGKTSEELDLRNQHSVENFFKKEKPDVVIDAAARVGGILANNDYPYQFLMENLQIQNNLIDCAHRYEVGKFIFLGSSCIYPKYAPQPLKEEYLMTGGLETTNEWYAIAKIAGVKACEAIRKQYGKDFISLMPTNLYGSHDNFDLETSHVLPAMIRKFHEAKMNNHSAVQLWGSGKPMREFLYVDDLADAVLFVLTSQLSGSFYNVGTGKDITLKELAQVVQTIIGHTGEIFWDISKPDGTPRKLMDTEKLRLEGWKACTSLKEGIKSTTEWFLKHQQDYQKRKI